MFKTNGLIQKVKTASYVLNLILLLIYLQIVMLVHGKPGRRAICHQEHVGLEKKIEQGKDKFQYT